MTQYHLTGSGDVRSCSHDVCPLTPVSSEVRAVITANKDSFSTLDIDGQKNYIVAAQRRLDALTHVKLTPRMKTAYRETGCILGILSKKGLGKQAIMQMSGSEYVDTAMAVHAHLQAQAKEVLTDSAWERGYIPSEVRDTILANYLLGGKIRGFYYYHRDLEIDPDTVQWVGDNHDYAPADVSVNGELWSLKDKSDILKNQSPGTLLNTITDSQEYSRGFHLLDTFASEENLAGLNRAITFYDADHPEQAFGQYDSYSTWRANSKNDQKRLSRYIRDASKTNNALRQAMAEVKTHINNAAAERMMEVISVHPYSEIHAGNLLGVEREYFYAKINHDNSMETGYVPSQDEIDEHVTITDIRYTSGPQLNLFIHYMNKREEELVTMSEIRYSHGQFCGVPEAKMKVYSGNLLTFVDNGKYPKKQKKASE